MFHYPSAELMREKQNKTKPEIGASSRMSIPITKSYRLKKR